MTALILAGGRGSRMGGVDKGLQIFRGLPLAQHALFRLRAQAGEGCAVAINANRNLSTYAAWGVPVWPDITKSDLGPLAGFATGLQHCTTPWLLTVPCDTPLFPLNLAQRLMTAATERRADIVMAAAPQEDGNVRTQPVFCLMHTRVGPSLTAFLESGQRKIDRWTELHATEIVSFDGPTDDRRAFFNLNTLAELQALENP